VSEEKGPVISGPRLKAYRAVAWAETAWLILFGFMVFAFVRTRQLELFLAPGWIWLELAGAALAVILGTAAFVAGRTQEEEYIRECARSRGPLDPFYRAAGLVLLLSVLVMGFLVPGRTLSVNLQGDPAAGGYKGFMEEALEKALEKEPAERTAKDWIIIFTEDEELESRAGERVILTGKAWVRDDQRPDEFVLVRYLFSHCVACAQPMFIVCRLEQGREKPLKDQWVKVTGEIALEDVDGEKEPYVEAEDYRVVPTPEDPYIYP
jgi:uncharacterized repeat protein (TIGR03943 family)